MASARGFTEMTACSRPSYNAMRASDCMTISRDVVRLAASAARMAEMLASTTEYGFCADTWLGEVRAKTARGRASAAQA